MLTATIAAVATAANFAIVTQDNVALRAAPRDAAPQQVVLWGGDNLEVRGAKGDFLQVYDHRHERAGYVRATQVRVQSLKPEAAPELLAVVRFLRDTPGAEALGIGYAAAYLKAAPSAAIDGEPFDALGAMAERLAQRASTGRPGKAGETVAAQLEVASAYGVNIVGVERDGEIRLCYEGEAFRRVMALPATDTQKAEAALALTRHDCVPQNLPPTARFERDNWRAELLDRIDTAPLPPVLKNRLHLRKAGVWASLTYQRARREAPDSETVHQAATRAIDELAVIDKSELTDSDAVDYNNAAMRVGASRWGAAIAAGSGNGKPTRLTVQTTAGQPGETCVHLVDAKHGIDQPLFTRCTYGVVWTASAIANPTGDALTLAVQPTDTWREMWVFRRDADGWGVDVLPPAAEGPGLGYVEFAGWVPGGKEMLAARETRIDGRYRIGFEVLGLQSLETLKRADKPRNLSTFYRWQSPGWKAGTVSLR